MADCRFRVPPVPRLARPFDGRCNDRFDSRFNDRFNDRFNSKFNSKFNDRLGLGGNDWSSTLLVSNSILELVHHSN